MTLSRSTATSSSQQLRRLGLGGSLLLMLALCLTTPTVKAWSESGHVAIAEVAYQQLDPEEQSILDGLAGMLVRQEPQLKALARRYPQASATALTAAWLDTVRGVAVKDLFERMDVPVPAQLKRFQAAETDDWHYSNIIYRPAGELRHADCPAPGGHLQTVLPLLRAAFEELPREGQAVVLAMLTHLVADAHQPLHSLSRALDGSCRHDRGGNSVCVDRKALTGVADSCETNLHRLWDQGLGLFRGSWKQQLGRITPLAKSDASFAPGDWQSENRALAAVVYGFEDGEPLSEDYLRRGRNTARQRGAQAAARLAALLESLVAAAAESR